MVVLFSSRPPWRMRNARSYTGELHPNSFVALRRPLRGARTPTATRHAEPAPSRIRQCGIEIRDDGAIRLPDRGPEGKNVAFRGPELYARAGRVR